MAKGKKQSDKIEMTQDSYDDLVTELEHRKNVERDTIASEIASARELGDLSENHAYTVAMEKKDMNENRIKDIEDLIKNVVIVKSSASSKVVTIGKKVTVVNTTTKQKRVVTLAGAQETEAADPSTGTISIDSPIGSAILNSKAGDVVEVTLPAGVVKYKVESIA